MRRLSCCSCPPPRSTPAPPHTFGSHRAALRAAALCLRLHRLAVGLVEPLVHRADAARLPRRRLSHRRHDRRLWLVHECERLPVQPAGRVVVPRLWVQCRHVPVAGGAAGELVGRTCTSAWVASASRASATRRCSTRRAPRASCCPAASCATPAAIPSGTPSSGTSTTRCPPRASGTRRIRSTTSDDGVAFFWNDEGETDYFTFHDWNLAQAQTPANVDPTRRFYSINRAWSPGMARLGATVWTGDIHPTWDDLAITPGTMLKRILGGAPSRATSAASPARRRRRPRAMDAARRVHADDARALDAHRDAALPLSLARTVPVEHEGGARDALQPCPTTTRRPPHVQ